MTRSPSKTKPALQAKRGRRSAANGRKEALGRDAWLKAARTALIQEGIAAVQIGKLARRLKVTRGGFYWFFSSRKQLLDELLSDWEQTNTAAFKEVLQPGKQGAAEFQALVDIWISEERYSPAWDAAVRDWARTSTKVANAVRRIDDERIEILRRIFLDLGYEGEEAFVRARIVYFHQIGYYTLDIREPRERRLQLLPLYTQVLAGKS